MSVQSRPPGTLFPLTPSTLPHFPPLSTQSPPRVASTTPTDGAEQPMNPSDLQFREDLSRGAQWREVEDPVLPAPPRTGRSSPDTGSSRHLTPRRPRRGGPETATVEERWRKVEEDGEERRSPGRDTADRDHARAAQVTQGMIQCHPAPRSPTDSFTHGLIHPGPRSPRAPITSRVFHPAAWPAGTGKPSRESSQEGLRYHSHLTRRRRTGHRPARHVPSHGELRRSRSRSDQPLSRGTVAHASLTADAVATARDR